ncbi:MAG TPA: MBL fold metallo-hydrolase [Thermoplasmatales archaeon]|nr:MBL fold metallo-hydrolase [Thermoplasmatales archaeon]
MKFEQVTSEGLAHHSYFVSSDGQAAVIDPRRDVDVYLHLASRHQAAITHIFETHRNEDYVIGSLELAERTGAAIYHGAALDFGYGRAMREGDTFTVGALHLRVLETPGHTDESISLVLTDTAVSEHPYMVFTGDTLFAGDVGRTDLYGEGERERLAAALHQSLTSKILPLGDHTVVCPAHGAGSVCGGAIGDLPLTTIGYEKKTNPLLALSREEFVSRKTREQMYRPPYFRKMEDYNRRGPPLLHHLPHLTALSAAQLQEQMDRAQVVDIRKPVSFAAGHIPGSLNIWRGGVAAFAGWYLEYERPIILVDDYNLHLDEATRSFLRLGYDRLAGYLADGVSTWFRAGKPPGHLDLWPADRLRTHLDDQDLFILDVRDREARRKGYIPGSRHIYAGLVPENREEIPEHKNVVVYCDAGFKTGVVASYLRQQGYPRVTELVGGMAAWRQTGQTLHR